MAFMAPALAAGAIPGAATKPEGAIATGDVWRLPGGGYAPMSQAQLFAKDVIDIPFGQGLAGQAMQTVEERRRNPLQEALSAVKAMGL